jgi:dihydrodipicolinate synthase/N-acetylneuraminate lyase
MIDLSGELLPLLTPFTDDASSLSEVRLARFIRALPIGDFCGLVTSTETGEYTTTGSEERKLVATTVIRESGGLPVIMHVSAASTATTLNLTQHAEHHGAKAVLVTPPAYPPLTDQEAWEYFTAVTRYCSIPCLIADPWRRLNEAVLKRLADAQGLTVIEAKSTEEFKVGGARCCPLAVIRPYPPEAEPELLALLRDFGGARVGKAAMILRDVEVGPPRPPVQPLPPEPMGRLRAALGL